MLEATTTQETKNAIKRAHQERSQMLRDAWTWLFPSGIDR